MPKFMSSHTVPPGAMTQAQIEEFARAAQQDPTVRGYRSFVNLSAGKAFCVLEATNKEAVAAWFQKMGMPCDVIEQVELEGDRGNIQRV
jgi:hypothetical protein